MTWNDLTETCGVWYIYKSKEEMFYCKQMHYSDKKIHSFDCVILSTLLEEKVLSSFPLNEVLYCFD